MLLINKSIGFGDKFLWFCLQKHAYFSWILYVRHYLELHYWYNNSAKGIDYELITSLARFGDYFLKFLIFYGNTLRIKP
mgnify:CR=1 FL=1